MLAPLAQVLEQLETHEIAGIALMLEIGSGLVRCTALGGMTLVFLGIPQMQPDDAYISPLESMTMVRSHLTRPPLELVFAMYG